MSAPRDSTRKKATREKDTTHQANAARKQDPPRRGLRALAAAVADVARPALAKRGLAVVRILTDWPDIVGPALAAESRPERLVSGGRERGGTLHVRVAGVLAPEFQHLAPQIIERINAHFGYRAVERLRLVQAPLSRRPPADAAQPRARRPAATAPPDPEMAARIAEVENPDLRRALEDLGRAVEGAESE